MCVKICVRFNSGIHVVLHHRAGSSATDSSKLKARREEDTRESQDSETDDSEAEKR